ncbi:MAG: MerR family transcriptional regulator [Parvibaculaceae bacterium]|nr:MerR family transcriptional regulator [Parvibaculaceae bacterium]
MAQKSREAFRTISEVAEELDVPQHVLRFWESKFTQIRPMKRGGGRRYYRPEDVDLLRGVRALLYSNGFTIRGVQKVFREHGAKFVSETGRGIADTAALTLVKEAVRSEEAPVPSPRRSSAPAVTVSAAVGSSAVIGRVIDQLKTLKVELDRGRASAARSLPER